MCRSFRFVTFKTQTARESRERQNAAYEVEADLTLDSPSRVASQSKQLVCWLAVGSVMRRKGGWLEMIMRCQWVSCDGCVCVCEAVFIPSNQLETTPHGRAIRCRAKTQEPPTNSQSSESLTLLTIAWFPHKTTQTHLMFICLCVRSLPDVPWLGV